MPQTRTVAITAGVFIVAFATWLLSGISTEKQAQTVDDIVLVLASIPPVIFALLAARANRGRFRAGWLVFAAALTAWLIAQTIWAFYQMVLGVDAFPTPADGFFLLFPLGAAVAMLLFWNRRGARPRGRILLDGVIMAGSLFIISWVLVVQRLYQSGIPSKLEFGILLAYPLFDLVALTIAAAVLVSVSSTQRLSMTMLTLGMVCMWAADSGYAFLGTQGAYASGHEIDIIWVAALMLFTAGAAAGRTMSGGDDALDEVPGWASVWLPYLPLMLAAAVVSASPLTMTSSRPVWVTGAVLLVAVLMRQYLVVEQNRRLLSAVANQALHDPLTGLANRTLFDQRLGAALADPDATVAVIVIDLDDFKLTNDTLGHAAGDELLIGAGRRIAASVRSDDVVARLGGDEFAVLMTGSETDFTSTAERIMQAFDRSIVVEGHLLLVRPSLGLSVADHRQSAPSADELLKEADIAMYAAKRSPESRIRIFDEDLARSHGTQARPTPDRRGAGELETVRLFGQLRRAIEERQLTLVYQPKFVLATRAMLGVEALLRWPHPERGVLAPDEFLPLVRQHGLTGAVTDFVLNQALDDARTWQAAGLDLGVAINLFPPSLGMADLPQRIDEALAQRGLSAAALTVEITEDMVLGDVELARQVLAELRRRGVTVSIDDFGSGYSALWYLRDLPVDEMKLDRRFIAPVAVDPRAAAVVRAVIDLARVLGIATVAEGVEDAATADVLRRYGCDMVQGYYFGPPCSAREVLELGLASTLGVAASGAALPH